MRNPQARDVVRKAVELNPANKRQLPKNTNFQILVSDPAFLQIIK